jgi:Smg protein
MFEVLVYMFENYVAQNICPDQDTLAMELLAAGFEDEEINDAVDWINRLNAMADDPVAVSSQHTLRIYAADEMAKLEPDALSFLSFLLNNGIIQLHHHEIIIERAMALPQPLVHLEEVRWIAYMLLKKQGREEELQFAEEAIFEKPSVTLH